MGDALDALAIGAFVAVIVYVTTWAVGDRERASRAAATAFCTATPVNYLGRRLLASRGSSTGEDANI